MDDVIAVRLLMLLMPSPRLHTSAVVLLSGLLAEGLRAVIPRIQGIWGRRYIAADHLLPSLQGYEVLIKGDKQQNGANKAGQVFHGKVNTV